MAFNLGIGINLGGGLLAGTPPQAPANGPDQRFQTISLPNGNLAFYALSIRDFKPPYSALYGYIFPLSPSSISKEFTAMTNIYDVQGGAATNGVQRIADQYGTSYPTFTLEGTTGWQYHSTDGFNFTGLDSIMVVQALLNQYAALNRGQQLANQTLYPLEYYDYFGQEFWTVVPIGPQTVRQSADRPLLFNYSFRFAALGGPVGEIPDPGSVIGNSGSPIDQLFGISGGAALSGMNSCLSLSLNNYGI